ncbi:hypothetical protein YASMINEVIRUS_270 [Yasminevirus sp. GU-2018]|uniref:Transmembrane protein n=1 Tax=Yasminevirus sp. GU-2018 TaxID=2420051 RepID=A0A5K0U7P0_9VIRU|nr:hypothetical protein YASMINEVIRUS_270 [Yasminevirus sp. GU-2018]
MTDKGPNSTDKQSGDPNSPTTTLKAQIPQLFQMMQQSAVMSLMYEYIIKTVSTKTENIDFLKNKTNVKYITLGICLALASTLIGMLSFFLFYVMFFFSSLKCILWLFEGYTPENANQIPQTTDPTRYVAEFSAQDVLEYYVVPIFIVLVMYPMAYIPLPFVSIIVYGASVMLCLACMTNKVYRQKFCVFVRDLFTSRNSRDENGKYVPGHEGEFHKLLQALCYSIECINLSTFNITHTPLTIFYKLNEANTITEALGFLTDGLMVSDNSSGSTGSSAGGSKQDRGIYTKQTGKSKTDKKTKSDKSVNLSVSSDNLDDEFDEDL